MSDVIPNTQGWILATAEVMLDSGGKAVVYFDAVRFPGWVCATGQRMVPIGFGGDLDLHECFREGKTGRRLRLYAYRDRDGDLFDYTGRRMEEEEWNSYVNEQKAKWEKAAREFETRLEAVE